MLDIEINQPAQNFKTKWELIKLVIRNMTLKYSARKNKSINQQLAVLERKIKTAEEQLHLHTVFNDAEQHFVRLKNDYNNLLAFKTQ